jgi:hypothetical protein
MKPLTMQYRGDGRLGFWRRWVEAAGNGTVFSDSMYHIETLLHETLLQVRSSVPSEAARNVQGPPRGALVHTCLLRFRRAPQLHRPSAHQGFLLDQLGSTMLLCLHPRAMSNRSADSSYQRCDAESAPDVRLGGGGLLLLPGLRQHFCAPCVRLGGWTVVQLCWRCVFVVTCDTL